MKTKIILLATILFFGFTTFAAPSDEGKTTFAANGSAKTDYISLVLNNKGLLISSLALVAILIAALWFVIKTTPRSKTS